MPAPVATVPDLDTVMAVGNSTTYAYYGTGMGMGTATANGPITYTPNDGDYTILCDANGGNVNIDLDPSFPNMYYIKVIAIVPGNIVRINVSGSGSIDGFNPYVLTRQDEAILVVKNGASDYSIVSSHLSNGTVNSGKYADPSFTGTTINIPHQLNTVPDSAYITAGNALAATLLSSDYYINLTATDLIIELSAVGAGISIEFYWGVTKN
jgi:hypothetical protein